MDNLCQLLSEWLRDAFFVLSAMSFFINLEAVPGSMSVEEFWQFLLVSPKPSKFPC